MFRTAQKKNCSFVQVLALMTYIQPPDEDKLVRPLVPTQKPLK